MITLREIADNDTHISSTRWAFALVIIFDIIMITFLGVTGVIAHFIGKAFDTAFYTSMSLLLGIPTGIVTTAKSLQGFEKHSEDIK
jgi:hypothetical protein